MRTVVVFLLLGCLSPVVAAQDLKAEYPDTYPSHYLAFFPADSTTFPPVYPDQDKRDSIAARFEDAHPAARAIERYALQAQDVQFAEREEGLGGDSLRWDISDIGETGAAELAPNLKSQTDSTGRHFYRREHLIDWTFERYYPGEELAVFRKWKEGDGGFRPDGYLLFSLKPKGGREDLLGRPVFSPSMKLFVTLKGSVKGGPTDNAIQLYRLTEGTQKINHVLTFRAATTPSRCKWIDNDTLILEAYDLSFSLEDGYSVYEREYYRVETRKPRH